MNFPVADNLDRAATWLAAFATRRRLPLLGLFSVAYFASTVAIARGSAFWFDELFTYYIATQPAEAVLDILRSSLDHQPPTFYFVTGLMTRFIPNLSIALPMPQIIGIWIACIATYLFVARRSTPLFGFLAVFLLLGTLAYPYAVEARPYGMATGFAALALLAWQLAADGVRRSVTLPTVTLALVAGVSSHYYAVLTFFPLAVGETARLAKHRRIDWGMVGAIAAGAALCAVYLPFVAGSVGGFEANNWASPGLRRLYNEYLALFSPLAASLLLLFVLSTTLIAFGWVRLSPEGSARPTEGLLPDLAAALGMLALPVVQYVMAITVTNKMHERYVLQATVGFAVAAAFLMYALARRHRWLAALATIIGILQFAGHVVQRAGPPDVSRPPVQRLAAMAPQGLPIVVDDAQVLLPVAHHSPAEFRTRLYYPVDPEAARRFAPVPPPKGGTNWLRNQDYMPVQAVPLDEFRSTHTDFLVYSTNSPAEWVLRKGLAEGAHVQLVAQSGRHWLYRVSYSTGLGGTSPTVSSMR